MDTTAIREALTARGWTQTTVGDLLGLEQPQVSRRLRGVHSWRVSELKSLADALGCTVDDLLADELAAATRQRLEAARDANPAPEAASA